MRHIALHCIILTTFVACGNCAFLVNPMGSTFFSNRGGLVKSSQSPVVRSSSLDDMDKDEEEEVEAGKMRVSEIKSELEMRGIGYSDCFDKESLVLKLEEARASGRADPVILDTFNKKKLEENVKGEKLKVDDEVLENMVANDGTLPGGMSPDMMKKLMSNPEVMTLLQSTKMQEAMKLMMAGGPEDLERAMAEDNEMRDVLTKLNEVLGEAQ